MPASHYPHLQWTAIQVEPPEVPLLPSPTPAHLLQERTAAAAAAAKEADWVSRAGSGQGLGAWRRRCTAVFAAACRLQAAVLVTQVDRVVLMARHSGSEDGVLHPPLPDLPQVNLPIALLCRLAPLLSAHQPRQPTTR